MALSSRDRVRYARHLLLAEIGSAGQERLCAAQVALSSASDAGARETARDYLQRAGVQVHEDAAELDLTFVSVGDEAAVQALAGTPELAHAARALLGAFAATEVIKRATGRGTPATFPALLCLSSEDA